MNNTKTNIKTKNSSNNIKKALLFALSLLPVAIVGGICTAIYQLDTLSKDMVQQADNRQYYLQSHLNNIPYQLGQSSL